MNRFLLGVAILLIFLLLGIWVAEDMDNIHLDIARHLEQASGQVLSGDWKQATRLAEEAKNGWEKNWKKTACVADHTPMDEIDGLFVQLKAFEKEQEAVHYASTCAQLSKLVQAMAEAHSFSWWSLL